MASSSSRGAVPGTVQAMAGAVMVKEEKKENEREGAIASVADARSLMHATPHPASAHSCTQLASQALI